MSLTQGGFPSLRPVKSDRLLANLTKTRQEMLNHLHISNFAIVPTLDLDVHSGFTAITGETGAGKSILVDALGLLLGERSDAAWVRPGAERAELSAEFSLENNAEARKWLEELELSSDDNCLLRRTINSNGRSRAFINGSPVTVAQMQALGQLLVEIHGQNEHLRLTRTAEQFRLLDDSGNYAAEMTQVEKTHTDWQRTARELGALEQDVSVSPGELEFLNYQLEELQQFDLSAASLDALQNEHDRLAAGGSLLEALSYSLELLDPESSDDHAGINSDLNTTLGYLRKFIPLDTHIREACDMLQEAAVNCAEAVNSLRAARDRVDLNPERFEAVGKTLGDLHDLARKHHVRMEGLEEVMLTLAARIERAGGSEHRRSRLQAELQMRHDAYRSAANKLHEKRKQHAADLSRRVTALMAELGMAGGTFELAVSLNPQARPSLRGDDEVQIRISANPGLPPGPLNKIASGGELSRISLAIKVAASGSSESITQIFDEVDAGIGGETANAVGKLMKRLAGNGQALCVTHLAQVAVCANHQLQVRKATGNQSTLVDTRLLDETGRIDEIARMLSGKISEQSRAHAIELLSSGAAAH
jgi:DNA repair protein RecN (Recombination protein N)